MNIQPFQYASYFSEDEGGYLESAISNIRGSPTKENPNIWSVNFHGLSPFDTERGPEGCIKFKYLLEDQIPTQVSLKVSAPTRFAEIFKESIQLSLSHPERMKETNFQALGW